MKLFLVMDCDFYVAESEQDALRMFSRWSEDQGLGSAAGAVDVEEVPAEKQITVTDDQWQDRTLTAAEWCAERPAGFLCTTEW